MPWVAAVGAVAGGVIGSEGAKSAAGTEAKAAEASAQVTQNMFNTEQAQLAPWVQSGGNANSLLSYLLGTGGAPSGGVPTGPGGTPLSSGALTTPYTGSSLFMDPSYQFTLGQGLNAVQNAASTGGGVAGVGPGGAVGGNTLKAITDYATGAASTEYQTASNSYYQYLNNLFGMLNTASGTGANAAGMTAGLGSTAAGQIGNSLVGGANAGSAGTIGVANATSGAIGGVSNAYLTNALINKIGSSNSNPNIASFNSTPTQAGDINSNPFA